MRSSFFDAYITVQYLRMYSNYIYMYTCNVFSCLKLGESLRGRSIPAHLKVCSLFHRSDTEILLSDSIRGMDKYPRILFVFLFVVCPLTYYGGPTPLQGVLPDVRNLLHMLYKLRSEGLISCGNSLFLKQ